MFYEIWQHAGAAGLIVFSALVTTGGFILLYLRCPAQPQAAAAVASGCIGGSARLGSASADVHVCARQSVSVAAGTWTTATQAAALDSSLVPSLVESARGICSGSGAPARLCGGTWYGKSFPAMHPPANCESIWRAWLALLACLALVPLNPSGTQLYRYPLDVLRSAGMRSFIVEWTPPDFHQLRYLPLFLIWVAASGSAGDRPLPTESANPGATVSDLSCRPGRRTSHSDLRSASDPSHRGRLLAAFVGFPAVVG